MTSNIQCDQHRSSYSRVRRWHSKLQKQLLITWKTVKFTEKCTGHNLCLSFLYCSNKIHSNKRAYLVRYSYITDTHKTVCASSVVMRYSHDVHETNTCRADHVCLSVRTIQLEKWRVDFDEMRYGRNASADYPMLVLFNFLQSAIPTWRTDVLVRWEWLPQLNTESHNDVWIIHDLGTAILCTM
jgi:hypothetical protein